MKPEYMKPEPLPEDIRLYGEACDEFFNALRKDDYKAFVRADKKCDEISTKYNWRGLAANRNQPERGVLK